MLDAFDDEKSLDYDDDDDDKSTIANQDVQDEDEYTVLFHITKLGLDSKTGEGRNGAVVVVSKVSNDEYKHLIHPNDIILSINTIRLAISITLLKDVFSLIESSKRPLLIQFSRAEAAKKTAHNRKKKENKKKKKQKVKEGRTQVIRGIEIEIEDLQHIIDNETGTVRKLAQKDMVKLLNKRKMVASNE